MLLFCLSLRIQFGTVEVIVLILNLVIFWPTYICRKPYNLDWQLTKIKYVKEQQENKKKIGINKSQLAPNEISVSAY